MSNFTGQKIANTYKQLLQVNTSNSDLSSTLITVETGAGNATPLQLATDKVNINGTFQLGGETLTANVSALNNIADLSGITGIVVGDSGSLSGRTLVGGSPIIITNANGTAGNPTISLATTGITSATYGPLARLNIDTYGRVIDVSIATTVSANSFIGGVFNGSSLTVENNTSIGGDVVIQGTTNMKAVSATDVTLNNLTVGTKITAATVTATTIETSVLRATKASITDLTADTLSFDSVSVSSINTNIVNVVSSTNLSDNATLNFGDDNDLIIQHNGTHSVIKEAGTGDLFIQSNRIQLTNTGSFSMLTLADGQDAEFPYGVQVSGTVSATSFVGPTITSINNVIANVSALTQTNLDAVTSINTVVDNLSATMATSIDNRTQAITSINNVITNLSATFATSINNTNTNVTTNINAITSINTVITDLSATMATSIDNRTAAITSINSVITDLSATMATSIDNRTQAITSINTVITDLSATMATSIDNTNTNVTTNINAITSINTVVANLSATMATSIDNTNGAALAFAIALG